ncbi:MAG: hypothetical protein JNK82_40350 [Myxococcaceae bacterium]|nr:hypothetical protein [Myxococcaceae bacterium]
MTLDRNRKLSLIERAFLATINGLGDLVTGYTIAFGEELVRQHGLRGFFKWAGVTQKTFDEICAHFGVEDAHLMASLASFWNGCDYCAYGHMLAHNLYVFERTGELFPVDEEDVVSLMRMRDSEVMGELRSRLGKAAAYARKLELVERKNHLRLEEGPADGPDDKMLLKCIALYEWVNECSIVAGAPAPPLGVIAKKKALHQRYLEARAPERASRPRPVAAAPKVT